MTQYAQINSRGDVSRSVQMLSSSSDIDFTIVRRTSNQTIAAPASIGQFANVSWQVADINSGAWSNSDPEYLSVDAAVGEEYCFGAQISFDIDSTNWQFLAWNFSQSTGNFWGYTGSGVSPVLEDPMGMAGVFGVTYVVTSGSISSGQVRILVTQAGLIKCAIGATSEGTTRTYEAGRSAFWVYKLR